MSTGTVASNIDSARVAQVARDIAANATQDGVNGLIAPITSTIDSARNALTRAQEFAGSVSRDPAQTQGRFSRFLDWLSEAATTVRNKASEVVSWLLSLIGITPAAATETPAPGASTQPPAENTPPAPAPAVASPAVTPRVAPALTNRNRGEGR